MSGRIPVLALAALATLASLAGCGIGFGSAFVGQWRKREQVELDACLVDEGDRCVEHKQIATPVPARRFWGAIITYPTLGAALVTEAGVRRTRLRFTPSLELMRGWGPFAVAVRAGVQVDLSAGRAVPVVALAHLSLTERLSVHAGGGYVPYARLHGERAYVGAQGLAGIQLGISRTRAENYVVISLEADTTWVGFAESYRSSGLSGHLGIFF
jgi:hypothetical protein